MKTVRQYFTPKYPLPTFPPEPNEPYGQRYALAHPRTVETHVRCFCSAFDNSDPKDTWSHNEFGPWAAQIGYSLYLLAWDIEGGPLGYEHPAPGVCGDFDGVVNQLRDLSGHWMFLYPDILCVDSIRSQCHATLDTLAKVSSPICDAPPIERHDEETCG